MKLNDGLPEKICKNCLTAIKQAASLRKTCRASDVYLQNLLERTKSASSLFKPQWQPEDDMEDDLLSCHNNNEEEDAAEQESSNMAAIEQTKQTEILKRKASSPLAKDSKQLCSTRNSEDNKIKCISQKLISHDNDVEEVVEENDLTNIVEEILDRSQNLGAEDQQKKTKTLDLQDFHITDDGTEFEETPESDIKYNNEQLYFVVKDEVAENITSDPIHEHNEEMEEQNPETDDTEDENVQYIPDDNDVDDDEDNEEETEIDEERIIHLESDMEDNQAQVTSTVDTREEQEEFIHEIQDEEEQNSTLSNDLQTEYIVDEYLLDDANSNISTRNSSVVVLKAKSVNSNRTKTIHPERKTKSSGQNKIVPTSSVGGMQVWICDLCGNHFAQRQLLHIHMKIHRQEKKHECE